MIGKPSFLRCKQSIKVIALQKCAERRDPRRDLLLGHGLVLQDPMGQLLADGRGVVDMVTVIVQICDDV